MNNEEQEIELTQNDTNETESDSSEEESTDFKGLYEAEAQKVLKLKEKLYLKETSKKSEPITNNRSPDEKWRTKMELKVEGYDDDDVDFILKNGGKKALENPYVTAAIEQMKVKKSAENATLSETGGKSQIEKRFSPSEFAKLSHADQLKAMSELK